MSIELKQHDNGVFYIHWTEPSPRGQRGRSKRESTRTKELATAKTYLSNWLLIEKGRVAPGDTLTIERLWEKYEEMHVLVKTAAPDRIVGAWKNLQPYFGELAVSELSSDVVATYRAKRVAGKLGRPCKDTTVRLELSQLVACLNWCSSKKRSPPFLDRATVPHIELPPAAEPRDRWLTTEEIGRLLAAAAETRGHHDGRMSRAERFIWLALETGSRKTAILELTWDRVDFVTGVIHFERSGRKKTKKRRASVPISKALRPVLEQAYAERENNLVLDRSFEVDLIVRRAGNRAGVPGVTPHVLRHTAATHMARRGVPLWIIAKVLGNTVAMVERVYAKHCPEDLRAAVDAISGGATVRANGAQDVVRHGRLSDDSAQSGLERNS